MAEERIDLHLEAEADQEDIKARVDHYLEIEIKEETKIQEEDQELDQQARKSLKDQEVIREKEAFLLLKGKMLDVSADLFQDLKM